MQALPRYILLLSPIAFAINYREIIVLDRVHDTICFMLTHYYRRCLSYYKPSSQPSLRRHHIETIPIVRYFIPHNKSFSSAPVNTMASQDGHSNKSPLSTSGPIECALVGSALLNTPYLNKGSAFPPEERRRFKLTGMLPAGVQTLDQQTHRAYQQYSSRQDDLAKNTFLTSLKYQNEVLYYKVGHTTRRDLRNYM